MPTTISTYIKSDLERRIRGGGQPPVELTLAALARHYVVSLTPVREAVRELVAAGVLRKLENGRLAINLNGEDTGEVVSGNDEPARARLERADDLANRLAVEVIGLSLRGEAVYLREELTASRHGVGRTAIRQVFGRLAGRGLLEHVPRCGWRVRTFDSADLDAYLDVREVLELKALELARPHLVMADLRRMLTGNAPDGDLSSLDNTLHEYVVEKAGNPYIRDFFDRHGPYYTTLFDFAAPETAIVAEMARQHSVILQALIDDDWPHAREALAQHIRSQRPIVQRLMDRLVAQSA